MRQKLLPFLAYYLLAAVEFGFAGWALYAVLSAPGHEFPTVGVLLVGTGLIALYLAIRGHRRYRLRLRLMITGDPGTAEILQLTQTGTTQNNVPLFRIAMRIHAAAHGEYEKTIREYLTYDKIAAVSPGSTVSVKIDHVDRDKVFIDWSARP